MKVHILVGALALMIGKMVLAQNQIAGAGNTSCGKYVEFRTVKADMLETMILSWSQGFLSALNLVISTSNNRKPFMLPDPPSIMLFLDKYCRDNPLKIILDGNVELYAEIKANNGY